jgi:hypothetical protein
MIKELKMDRKTLANKKQTKKNEFGVIWAQLETSLKNRSMPILQTILVHTKPAQAGLLECPWCPI